MLPLCIIHYSNHVIGFNCNHKICYNSKDLPYVCTFLIGASLSKPHTSESSGTSVTFTKIYEVIWINGRICKHLRLKTGKTRLITSASGHYTKNYVSLRALHIRLVRTFITRRNTTLVYWNSI